MQTDCSFYYRCYLNGKIDQQVYTIATDTETVEWLIKTIISTDHF